MKWFKVKNAIFVLVFILGAAWVINDYLKFLREFRLDLRESAKELARVSIQHFCENQAQCSSTFESFDRCFDTSWTNHTFFCRRRSNLGEPPPGLEPWKFITCINESSQSSAIALRRKDIAKFQYPEYGRRFCEFGTFAIYARELVNERILKAPAAHRR